MLSKAEMQSKLFDLIQNYKKLIRISKYADDLRANKSISEETIRVWPNELLAIFGWDVKDTAHVLQEYVLRGDEHYRLKEINSTHRRPDYILKNGTNIKAFLDAKALSIDLSKDTSAAFQIRSYGWSAQLPCSFISNFEQFVIFDTRTLPLPTQPANYGAIILTVDEYIEKFDVLYEHLCFDLICNNHLSDIYASRAIEGKMRIDENFSSVLSEFRIKIAEDLLNNNAEIINSQGQLNYYTQIILDRIIFIRVCESKGIEELEKLKKYSNSKKGFWEMFRNSCYIEFYKHYDGAMFSHDSTFQSLKVKDNVINEFIEHLYYPYPYRFDVISVKAIANIYEEFLGKSLEVQSGRVAAVTKEEYVKTNGAVCTPEHIVDMICKQTISIENIETVDQLFQVKILEPCCGSGVFLISCYEILAEKLVQILSNSNEEVNKYSSFSTLINGNRTLTIDGRRAIVTNCLYGIDYDESAIEVTKMSLALKIVDGNNPLAWKDIGVYGEKILQDVSRNIRLGNTLVWEFECFLGEQIEALKPLDIRKEFEDVFSSQGGFTYIVGNPPYVETKHYKSAQPAMHLYLKHKYNSFEGKADLAVLFIERCLQLLAPDGFLGMIVQRRWFKTNYGKTARKVINHGGYLYKLIDFKATDIFKGRITYVSIMILNKKHNDNVMYYYNDDEVATIRTLFENSHLDGSFEGCKFQCIPSKHGDDTWAFESYIIEIIKDRLSKKWGILRDYPGMKVKDGIQALCKKMYHLTNVTFCNAVATGYNGFGEKVFVEASVLRAVIYNRVFYPFKDVQPDAYSIFPYYGASADAITYDVVEKEFPLLYNYLSENEDRIKNFVDCRDGNMWHTFTREQNHALYNVNKIIVPMTAKDTIATYIENQGLYMDNANVWFIYSDRATSDEMKALTCVINSTVFSVLGKAGANPQSGDYYKFNKQFLTPIPVPAFKLARGGQDVRLLVQLYEQIVDLQHRYLVAAPLNKDVISRAIDAKWRQLDEVCNILYELTDDEISSVMAIGRAVDRIALMNGV